MNKIDEKVFDGIRKTINRFRENPFHYFTEADIHSSLLNDIMSGGSGIVTRKGYLTTRENQKANISISLVHQEYPTHFRYEKKRLLCGYKGTNEEIKGLTCLESNHGDRGNYDLSILSPAFVDKMFAENKSQQNKLNKKFELLPLKHIINKDKDITKGHNSEELLYAIEVKFLHIFNAPNSNMLKEVIKDNEKLRLAHIHSNGKTKCINLVFCSAKGYSRRVKDEDEKESVSDRIKIYIEGRKGVKLYNSSNERQFNPPSKILNIFIESFINSNKKITLKPSTNYFSDMNEPIWANLLIEKLKISNTS